MHYDAAFVEVIRTRTAGRVRETKSALSARRSELQRIDRPLFNVLLAECDAAMGTLGLAADLAASSLSERREVAAFAHKVLGEIAAHRLLFEESLNHYTAARALCAVGVEADVSASIELSYWRCFSGILPLESAPSEFRQVRRAVA